MFTFSRLVTEVGNLLTGADNSTQQNDEQSTSPTESPAMTDTPGEESSTPDPSNHIELYVRAGRDGVSLGGCPLCHRVYMILFVKAEHGELTFNVTKVNLSKPSELVKRLDIKRLPAIVHGDQTLMDTDEIVQYIDNYFPQPPLGYGTALASDACKDFFSKFSFYLKDVSHSPNALQAELQKLDAYLTETGQRYMCRQTGPDHIDFIVLPKLQHLRVACHALKNFDIPANLTGLWRYMATAYQSEFFTKTCPSDQEILHHWLEKPECRAFGKEKWTLLDGTPFYSFGVPTDVKQP